MCVLFRDTMVLWLAPIAVILAAQFLIVLIIDVVRDYRDVLANEQAYV